MPLTMADGNGFTAGMANETKTYKGGCHCGQVKFEVETGLGQVVACNCSICSKKGHLLMFVAPDKFKMLAGEEGLTDYQFNKKNIHHLFCSRCGIGSFGHGVGPDGKKMFAINARCLEGLDFEKLSVMNFDGKSL